MKRGTKAAVFIASMALTVGSLIAIVGPRQHQYWGRHGHGGCIHDRNHEQSGCGKWNNNGTDPDPAPATQAK